MTGFTAWIAIKKAVFVQKSYISYPGSIYKQKCLGYLDHMRKRYQICYILLFYFTLLPVCAQDITNIRAETKGNLVIVFYDLNAKIAGQLYEVKVYSSHNNMEAPLTYVRGDVGTSIVPGKDKRLEWGAKKEIGKFNSELNLKIEARLIFSPIILKTPAPKTVVRRGRTYDITWDGGVEQENMQVELWKDSTLSFIITRTPNQGKYSWELPLSLVPADTYKVRLMSVTAPANFRFSEPFSVRRKIPLVAKIAPFVVAAGVGSWLLFRRLTATGATEDPLPGPPSLPPNPK